MKNTTLLFSILILLISSKSLLAQQNCQVLMSKIDSIYIGKCKKGLAHGKGIAIGVDSYDGRFSKGYPNGTGTYIWENGDNYTGNWENGKRNGGGTLCLKLAEKDSIIFGLWENDKYLGTIPEAPRVVTKISIDRYSFIKMTGPKKRVLINFLQNGSRNTGISNFMMISSKGVETSLGHLIGYEFIDFPVKIKVNYETLNKMKSVKYQATFEFIISEPGDWRVEIHN